MIYTDEPDFTTAVASLNLIWEEDFNSIISGDGSVDNPLSTAGGQAQVSDGGVTSIMFSSIDPTWMEVLLGGQGRLAQGRSH